MGPASPSLCSCACSASCRQRPTPSQFKKRPPFYLIAWHANRKMVSSRDPAIPSREPVSRKRRYSAHLSPLPIDDAQPPRRKHKVDHPTSPPPKFWDDLSKKAHIPLTKNALRELNRRNRCRELRDVSRLPLPRRSRRLAAQGTITADREPVVPVNQLRKFTSHGGPDLTDLRGVLYS